MTSTNKPTACIITGGLLDDIHAKTAHGLIRKSSRYKICGIIDEKWSGKEAGEILDGKNRGISIYESIQELSENQGQKPDFAIIGMATKGGILPEELYPTIKEALKNKIGIVNGLHQTLGDLEEFSILAEDSGAQIIDIRKPKAFDELHFWTGEIQQVKALKLAVLGTDCAVGKRTTSRFLEEELGQIGIEAEMIYTGQTGWLQGGEYGLILDATPNDFVCGEIEHAMLSCWKSAQPDVLILEGQSSLRNPSGPCGSEFIVSGNLDGVILQHDPARKRFNGLEDYPADMVSVQSEIELIRLLGSKTLAVTINTMEMPLEEVRTYQQELGKQIQIPVICPMEDGVAQLVQIIKTQLKK